MSTSQIDKPIHLTAEEADTLQCIQNRVDANIQQRYRFLNQGLEQERLTPGEHQELMDLINAVESINIERMEFLAEIAGKRNLSLAKMISRLSIGPLLSCASPILLSL